MSARTRVAPNDLVWLQLDRPDNPMVITGLMTFDHPMEVDRLVRLLEERLVARFPKFAQRIERDGRGGAWWVPDPLFCVRDHVQRDAVPSPGGAEGLATLVGNLMSSRLDPDRAPWHVHLVEGLGGGCAMVVRLHHVIADGISLARVLLQLADGAAVDAPERADEAGLAAAAARLWTTGRSWLSDPTRLLGAARLGAAGAAELAHLLALPPDPATPLHGPLGARKVVGWMAPIPLARVRAVGHAAGATVNDVLLAALARALGQWLRARGADVPVVRSFVPFNLRPLDQPIPRELGNQFGMVLLDLPVGAPGPREALAAMKAGMDTIKAGPQGLVTWAVLQGIAEVPDRLGDALVDFFGAKASLITTNVPGPRERLRLDGEEITSIRCWVPQSSAVGLGVSILSYAGEVQLGVAADARRVPDPAGLARAYADAIEEIATAYGVG